jgi:hypothetical protein
MDTAGTYDIGAPRRRPRRERLQTTSLIHPATTKQAQHSKMKDTVMKTKHNILSKISLSVGLAVALAFASGCATNTGTTGQMRPIWIPPGTCEGNRGGASANKQPREFETMRRIKRRDES